MLHWFRSYRKIDKSILRVILGEFFLQLITTGYFLIFNFLLLQKGYSDNQIASFLGYRFLAIMSISLPLGFYIQGRALMPIFRFSAILIPLSSLILLFAVDRGMEWVIIFGNVILGLGMSVMQIGFVPFIMRNVNVKYQTEAIALHFTTWSTTTFCLGLFSYTINQILSDRVGEDVILLGVTILGLVGVFLFFLPLKEVIPEKKSHSNISRSYDWGKIGIILTPSIIIGVGAGLTIPFINIFFNKVYGMSYDSFSLLGAAATFVVAIASMYGPHVLKTYGYKVSVTGTQSVAVGALFLLAMTEQFREFSFAFYVAVFCYLIRQPLMNMANPLLSQFTMQYVGSKNREMTSALQQSIWSGSWFFSSQIFAFLRTHGYSFTTVFTITAAIYGIGVVIYHSLISRSDHLLTKQVAVDSASL